MSKVFRALEKAEREKQAKAISEEPLFEIVETDSISSKNDGPVLNEIAKELGQLGTSMRGDETVFLTPMDSFAAEQFRKVKTHIFRIAPNPPRVILVTSTVPQEGKTTVTKNLAMSVAQEFHKKVIVIDADLRNPSVFPTRFENEKGLSDFLSNETSMAEILKILNKEKFIVIPAGAASQQAAELVGSKRMRELIRMLRGADEEAFIIIDSPPILATSEPLMLSEWVDGVIFVVMADQATRGSIKKAISSIDRKKIIGVVFNNKNLKPNKLYSDYYNSYRYYNKGGKSRDRA